MCRSVVCRVALGLTIAGIVLAAPRLAAARSITIAWDPNPEPVSGYFVYVGNEPGENARRYDVGKVTSFVFADAADNQRYYFSVAAYTADLIPGPRSAEVTERAAPSSAAVTAKGPDFNDAAHACVDTPTHECYTVRTLIRGARSITGLAATADDRLFFIDDRRQIRIIDGGRLSAAVALTVPGASRRISGIALGSDFAKTHFVYVGEIDALNDGSHELSVVRYREVLGVLGERAVIVPALAVRDGAEAILTTDSAGRIYVAMPSAGDFARSTRYAYGGSILRFNPDGTAPAENGNASPVFARGFDRPSAFAWNGETQLLVTGQDPNSSWLTRLNLAVSGQISSLGNRVFVIDRANRLNRILIAAGGTADAGVVTLPDAGRAIAIAQGPRSKTYVVASPAAGGGVSILEVTVSAGP